MKRIEIEESEILKETYKDIKIGFNPGNVVEQVYFISI